MSWAPSCWIGYYNNHKTTEGLMSKDEKQISKGQAGVNATLESLEKTAIKKSDEDITNLQTFAKRGNLNAIRDVLNSTP